MDRSIFIIASYCVAAFVIVSLIAWVAMDYRSLTRTLVDYEKRGVKRGNRRKKKS